jgi:perosamine synthetase
MERCEDFIPVCEPVLGNKELQYVTETVQSGWISSKGSFIQRFEEGFARYCGAKYGIAVCNGTVALHLALAVIGIGRGDEVIVPDFAMIACANSVSYLGARPVFVDAESETWCVDPSLIESKIGKRTKVIMPVHMYGHPVNMAQIMEVADRYELPVVEDAAEAHGAECRGKKVGAIGDIGCFSFYANKIITTGEGGMLVTSDEELAAKARLLRDQAFEPNRRFLHRFVGYNYRMTNMQAAIGLAQLERIQEFVEARRNHASLYNELLRNIEGLVLHPEAPWAKNVYWMYTILVEDSFGIDRDRLMQRLRLRGIDTRPTFYPLHLQPIYDDGYHGESFDVAIWLGDKGVNLPSSSGLSDSQIERVVSAIADAKKEK